MASGHLGTDRTETGDGTAHVCTISYQPGSEGAALSRVSQLLPMGVGSIPLDRAYLVAIWLETLLYGINICVFGSYVYILRFRRRRKIPPLVFWIAVLMFCFSSAHVSLGLARLIWGFIVHRDDPGGPAAFFSDVSQPPNVAKITIHTINSILGDSIVVWRCWRVWTLNWQICILPALLIIASAICGFGQAIIFAKARDIHSAFASILLRWNGSLFSLSLATNVVVTTLVAARIWFLTREFGGNALAGAQFRYTKLFVLVIESAMIYSAAILIEIILYFSNSNAFYIVYDPIAQLTGIVPTMIIIIATLGMTVEDYASDASATRRGSSHSDIGISSIAFSTRPTPITQSALSEPSRSNEGAAIDLYKKNQLA